MPSDTTHGTTHGTGHGTTHGSGGSEGRHPPDRPGTALGPGCWELWRGKGHEVILEIDPHVGFAYLYARGAMVSSVWLFNLPGTAPDHADALPDMPGAFLTGSARAPDRLEDIALVQTPGLPPPWTIGWGHSHAVPRPGANPGFSSAVNGFTPFARPTQELTP